MTWPRTEVGWMRLIACLAIIVLTLALASLNVSGAWLGSNGNFQFTMTVFGAEILAATALVLILSAPTWPRKVFGGIVFGVLIWVCIENGKMSVERSFKEVFVGSADALDQKAAVAKAAAETLTKDAPADLKALKEEKAKLEIERDLMKSNDAKGIKEAQTSLKTMGLYTLAIDGLRGPETEAAMLSRGIKIAERIAVLDKMIDPAGGASAAEQKANSAIDLADQANKVRGGELWMNMLLIGLEGARSFGLWCFVIWGTGKRNVQVDPSVFKDLQAQADELARRKANLADGQERAQTTKEKKKNRKTTMALLEDKRPDDVKREAVAPEAQEEPEQDVTNEQPEAPADNTAEDGADQDGNDSDAGQRDPAEPDQGAGRAAA